MKKNFTFFYDFLSIENLDSTEVIVSAGNTKNYFINKNKKINKNITNIVNINTADFDELIKIPYIGSKTAKKIIEMRIIDKFVKYSDLKKIPGIGDKKILKISKYIIFDTSIHIPQN